MGAVYLRQVFACWVVCNSLGMRQNPKVPGLVRNEASLAVPDLEGEHAAGKAMKSYQAHVSCDAVVKSHIFRIDEKHRAWTNFKGTC